MRQGSVWPATAATAAAIAFFAACFCAGTASAQPPAIVNVPSIMPVAPRPYDPDARTASSPQPSPPKPAPFVCAPAAIASANGALAEIDREIARFLDSPLGRQGGSATPSLQVVMWGTSQQRQVIARYCAQGEDFEQRAASLDASFKAAKEACLAIQTHPEVCRPVAPSQLSGQ